MTPATIRPVRVDELGAVGELTVGVYRAGRLAPEDYSASLADAQNRAEHTQILVAVDQHDRLLGAVALVLNGGPYAELAAADHEAEFRMLVVSAEARGRGVGTALIKECLSRARAAGKQRMVISTGDNMTAAHRRYADLGFQRAPDLDWSPMPEVILLAYVLELASDG
ncbi:MAG: GNAT family N-acetyltransferase [Actinomycetota bacterium]|nr:GNAT family N-acetyltransferase [Actinomycetota bacterium]